CKVAVGPSDLQRVDGFDAAYTGWGKEDSDLVVRLLHAGVARKDGRFATGVLHLWHPQADRSDLARNEISLEKVLGGDDVRARCGLSELGHDEAAATDTDARTAARSGSEGR